MNYNKNKTIESVYLAFNGRLHSQVSSILLSKQGYKVNAVYFYVNEEKLPVQFKGVMSKFLLDIDKVEKAAAASNLKLESFDVTEIFKYKIIDKLISERIELFYSNINQYIATFIFEMLNLKFPNSLRSTGHFIKFQNGSEGVEILRHTNLELDQSDIIEDLKFIDSSKFIFPLGDLGIKELENLSRKFSLKETNIEITKADEKHKVEDLVIEDLKFKLYDDLIESINVNLEFGPKKCSIDHMFKLDEDNNIIPIKVSSFVCDQFRFFGKSLDRPKKLFATTDFLRELIPVTLYPKTLNRVIIETEEALRLYPNQNIYLYESKYQNSKYIGAAKLCSYVEAPIEDDE